MINLSIKDSYNVIKKCIMLECILLMMLMLGKYLFITLLATNYYIIAIRGSKYVNDAQIV